MSDHESNHENLSDQDPSVSPTMKSVYQFIDSNARAERSSATPLPTEASLPPPRPIPVGSTQRSSPFIWPQPRGTPSTPGETVDSGTRRTPAAIRAASVARQSSMCIFQSDATTRGLADPFKGTESVATPTPMIDQRVDGGYFGPEGGRPKSRKMKWTAENDRSLLLFGFGRDISGVEYQAIANWFKEKPTAKAVQERLTKLRAAGRKVLKESGIFGADAPRNTPTTSRAPSVIHTAAPPQRFTTPTTPTTPVASTTPVTGITTPAPGPSSLSSRSSPQPPPRHLPPVPAAFALPGTLTPSTGAQGQQQPHTASLPSCLPPLPGTVVAENMDMGGMRGNMPAGAQVLPGNYLGVGRGVGRGVGQGSHTPFPRTLTVQQQDEQLARLYRQRSQQRVSSTTGVAGANMGGTAGETMSEHGGEEVDELRREEMQAEARKARLEARRHLGDM
jgi:hypothetical protein